MNPDRRSFLQSAAAAVGALALPRPLLAAPPSVELRAEIGRRRILAQGAETAIWGFNGTCPGPVLRLRQGEELSAHVTNALPQPTTVHWHGLRIPNAMDGVPGVTQAPIAPGEAFDYRFTANDAGTYWYHPHQSSFEQVPRGLHGLLVVEERDPPAVDAEASWVLGDFKLDRANQPVEDFGRLDDFGAAGRLGNTITVNGLAAGADRELVLRPGERVRLRLLNAASARIFRLQFGGVAPWVMSHDGQPVAPAPIEDGTLLLGPGQRTDLIVDAPADVAQLAVTDLRSATRIATLACRGKPLRAKPLARPAAIAPNRLADPDLVNATPHFVLFEGGARGAPAIGRVDGKVLDVKEIMAQHGLAWTMNYSAQHEHAMMHEPLFRLRRGEHATVKMINNTEFEHPMHLHGHFFKVIAANDRPLERPVWRDTVMVGARGSCDIAFVADNPGEWMFHCHILDHAAGGMMGTIVVEA